jgi:hypothetical protein
MNESAPRGPAPLRHGRREAKALAGLLDSSEMKHLGAAARRGRRAMTALVFAFALTSCFAVGTPEPSGSGVAVGVFPRVAYSGFNPSAQFRALFATSALDPQWSVADPAIATVVPSKPPAKLTTEGLSFALVTMTRAGETTVVVRSGTDPDAFVTARLVVKAYSDEALALGKGRYETSPGDPARVACASCHAKPEGVDHSPLKMAGFEDATILGVIQEATYPPTPTGQAVASDYAPKGPLKFEEHRWNLSEPEKVGILAHLRSLPLGGL